MDLTKPGDLMASLAAAQANASVVGPAADSNGVPGVLSPSGLLVPAYMQNAAIEYAGAYLTLSDYVDFADAGVSAGAMLQNFAKGFSNHSLLMHLALVSHLQNDALKAGYFREGFLEVLAPHVRVRVSNLLAGADPRRFLARQPLLAAMRYAVTREPDQPDTSDLPALANAAVVAHAVAVDLAGDDPADDTLVAGIPKYLFFEVLRASMLYESDDMWSSIDRFVRIWREFGSALTKHPARESLEHLLVEATGLDIDEMLGLGFAQWAHDMNWDPDSPGVFLALDYSGI